MVNNSKVRLMTKMAMYEKNNPEDISLSKYYRADYIKFNLIKTVLSATVAYICCLFLVGFYNIEYLISEAVRLDYKSLGLKILGIFIILQLVSCMINILISSEKFKRSRKRLNRYYKRLKQLRTVYEDEDKKTSIER